MDKKTDLLNYKEKGPWEALENLPEENFCKVKK
jgi:hypothetical protein